MYETKFGMLTIKSNKHEVEISTLIIYNPKRIFFFIHKVEF
jgi:hypothetical protein